MRNLSTEVLFSSGRVAVLRFVTIVCFVPVPLNVWLISLADTAEWRKAGHSLPWWLLPAGLIAFSLVMPAAMIWLHDRYVLEATRDGDRIRLTTFLLWGKRTRVLDQRAFGSMARDGFHAAELPPKSLIFDPAGDAPEGWEAVDTLRN